VVSGIRGVMSFHQRRKEGKVRTHLKSGTISPPAGVIRAVAMVGDVV